MKKEVLNIVGIIIIVIIAISNIFAMEEIPQSAMEIIYVDSEETAGEDGKAANVLDGDVETFWHTEWSQSEPDYPHEIIFKLDKEYTIENFSYWPRQNSGNGRIKDFQIFVSNDTSNWGEPVVQGQWPDKTAKQIEDFDSPVIAQFVKLVALSEVNENVWATAAEINLNDALDPNIDIDGWASSLHLGFRDDSNFDAQVLMVDIEVDSSSNNTYYAPINFTGGYCGIQDVNDSRRTLHFSLWDYVDGDVSAVPPGAEAKVLWKGYHVSSSGFGGEGTGVKTWKDYDWKNNQTYRLLVKMRSVVIDSFPGATRDYWVYDPEFTEWMHIATLWRADNPTSGSAETDLGEVHVFVEDWAATAEWHRSCYVFNARKKYRAGSWHTYEKAYYSINDQENNPATADGHDPNTQAEVLDNKIWLATGGDSIYENRTLSGTTLFFNPNNDFDPKNPGLTDIQTNIVNDSTVDISWDYKLPKWAAQECFDIRIYSDDKFNNLVYKTGDLFPHDYESLEWKKGSDRRYTLSNLDFTNGNTYFLRIVTKSIFGVNSWNSDAIEISKPTEIETKESELPGEFQLEQNYPNPFNPITNLVYSLPVRTHVNLSVFDLNGKKVRQVFDGIQNSGKYKTMWDGQSDNGSKITSGVYFAVLKTNINIDIRKMILIK